MLTMDLKPSTHRFDVSAIVIALTSRVTLRDERWRHQHRGISARRHGLSVEVDLRAHVHGTWRSEQGPKVQGSRRVRGLVGPDPAPPASTWSTVSRNARAEEREESILEKKQECLPMVGYA